MKKLLAIILAAACAVSLASCAAPTPSATLDSSVSPYAQEPSVTELAAPAVTKMPQYPKEDNYMNGGRFDSDAYSKDSDAWWTAYQAKTENMTAPGTLDSYFTRAIRTLMQGTGEENRVCSPLNIYMALSMLAAVTDGASQQQILDLLGSDSLEALQKQAAQLWTENSWDDGVVTSTLANSLWLRDGYAYHSETLQKLADEFYASAFSGEMGSAEYDNMLRGWINDNTGGLLTEQADGLKMDAKTVLALVSTIYFSAPWRDEFYEAANTQDTFHAPSGDMTTTFMHRSQSGTVYYGDGFMATGISLRNSGTMWLLKPDEGVTPEDLLQSDEALAFLLANGSWSQTQDAVVDLSLPKFDVSSDLDLIGSLKALGVTDVFDPDTADFTPLSPRADEDALCVSQAKHAARVKIDEKGVEAAAYTVLNIEATAAMPPRETIEFTLDEPFVFAVTGIDGLPLFVGLVNQPG